MTKKTRSARWQEYRRYRNQIITPRRKKFQAIGLVCLLAWAMVTVGGGAFCISKNFNGLWWAALLFFLGTICGVGFFIVLHRRLNRIEVLDELERLSYLFEKGKIDEDETLEVLDEEDGILCVFSKEGIRVKTIEEAPQVFDDGMDDGKFYPWEDLELSLATSNEFFRVRLALAVMKAVYNEESADEDLFIILPMQKNLALAMRTFCWEKLPVDWLYIFYQPYDAFMQIMQKGRIETLRDRETGEELTEEFCQNKNNE